MQFAEKKNKKGRGKGGRGIYGDGNQKRDNGEGDKNRSGGERNKVRKGKIQNFNARTRKEGGIEVEEAEREIWEEGNRGRQLKDKKVNREGRKLIECIEEIGWSIFNRNIKIMRRRRSLHLLEKERIR